MPPHNITLLPPKAVTSSVQQSELHSIFLTFEHNVPPFSGSSARFRQWRGLIVRPLLSPTRPEIGLLWHFLLGTPPLQSVTNIRWYLTFNFYDEVRSGWSVARDPVEWRFSEEDSHNNTCFCCGIKLYCQLTGSSFFVKQTAGSHRGPTRCNL